MNDMPSNVGRYEDKFSRAGSTFGKNIDSACKHIKNGKRMMSHRRYAILLIALVVTVCVIITIVYMKPTSTEAYVGVGFLVSAICIIPFASFFLYTNKRYGKVLASTVSKAVASAVLIQKTDNATSTVQELDSLKASETTQQQILDLFNDILKRNKDDKVIKEEANSLANAIAVSAERDDRVPQREAPRAKPAFLDGVLNPPTLKKTRLGIKKTPEPSNTPFSETLRRRNAVMNGDEQETDENEENEENEEK